MEEVANKNKKNLIKDIIIYTLVVLFFLFALIGVIFKFTGNRLYIFGKRYDVVLTDSMSEKNPEYQDFLEGHDDQFQPLDIAISRQIDKNEELQVYDIVIFNNRYLANGTDMHRIVGKTLNTSDDVKINNGDFSTLNNYSGIKFNDVYGGIVTNAISATEVTFVTFATENLDDNRFVFSFSSGFYTANVKTDIVEGGFLTTYKIEIPTTAPRIFCIGHSGDYDTSKEIVTECTIKSCYGDITINENNMTKTETGYEGSFNKTYLYEIRGDKSNTSDGDDYTIEEIQSKVVGNIPKLGYVVRYLSSVWGIVLFVGLGIIIITFDILNNKISKKEQEAAKDEQKNSN